MIRVEVYRTEDKINAISFTGHAMYAPYGKDIVCSSASTCLITTVNGISEIDDNYLNIEQTENKVLLRVQKENDICLKLLNNMINILEELEEQYPKNITMLSKEGNL